MKKDLIVGRTILSAIEADHIEPNAKNSHDWDEDGIEEHFVRLELKRKASTAHQREQRRRFN